MALQQSTFMLSVSLLLCRWFSFTKPHVLDFECLNGFDQDLILASFYFISKWTKPKIPLNPGLFLFNLLPQSLEEVVIIHL